MRKHGDRIRTMNESKVTDDSIHGRIDVVDHQDDAGSFVHITITAPKGEKKYRPVMVRLMPNVARQLADKILQATGDAEVQSS